MLTNFYTASELEFLSSIFIGNNPFDSSDPVGDYLRMCENISRPFDLRGVFGHPVDENSEVFTYLGGPPLRYGNDDFLKRIRGWSGFFSNIKSLFYGNFLTSNPLMRNENPIEHFNLKGVIETGTKYSDLLGRDLFPDYEYSLPNTLSRLSFSYNQGNVSMEKLGTIGPFEGILPVSILRNRLDNFEETCSYLGYPSDQLWYTNLVYYSSALQVRRFSYLVWQHWFDGSFWKWHVAAFRYTYKTTFTPFIGDFGVVYNISDGISTILDVDRIVLYSGSFLPGFDPGTPDIPWIPTADNDADWNPSWTNSYSFSSHQFFGKMNSSSSTFPDLLGLGDDGVYYYNGPRSFRGFREGVINIINDCLAMPFLASKEGIDKYFSDMEMNQLETMSELANLAGILDSVFLIKEFTTKFRKNRGIPLLFDLLDFLTNARLIYSFGFAPTLSDARKIATDSAGLLRKLRDDKFFSSPVYIRGSSSVKLKDITIGDFYYDDWEVISHVKMSVSGNSDSLLTSLIPLNSFGLLPSLSNLWDLFPLSFVIDWFTNVGASVDIIESSAALLALDVHYSVVSILVRRNFTSEEMDIYSFNSIFDGPPEDDVLCMQYYRRFVLNEAPMMLPTRLPILNPPGIPNWYTAGSLLYQRLF